jgi:hypothetical protein
MRVLRGSGHIGRLYTEIRADANEWLEFLHLANNQFSQNIDNECNDKQN